MSTQTMKASGHKHEANKSIRTALFLETFFLLAVAVLLTTVAAFFLGSHELRLRTITELQGVAQGRKDLLESTLARQREQIAILAHDPSLAKLPVITNLLGFQDLYSITTQGVLTHLAGENDITEHSKDIIQIVSRTKRTILEPIFTEQGWEAYVIATPQINTEGERTGTLIAFFDPKDIMTLLFRAEYLGTKAEVLLTARQGTEIAILHADGQGGAVPVLAGTPEQKSLIEKALNGNQGYENTLDYAGIPVLSVFQTAPSLGWTVIVQKDEYTITTPIWRLARSLIGIGLMLVGLLSLCMFFLAERVTEPLEKLATKLNGLETRHWLFERSIFTGNELEVVDSAAMDLTERLRRSYDHLEDIVRERTVALREQSAKDVAILENVEYGLVMTDIHGNIVSLNRAGEMLTGRTKEESLGKSIVNVLQIVDAKGDVLPNAKHPIHLVLSEQKSFAPSSDPGYSLIQKNGSRTALHIRVTPILQGKKCMGAVAVFRDTTEERHIDHVKSEFISLVSHQLRTPLSSMRWYLEMLLTDDAETLKDSQREYLEEVSTSNARMVRLVNALLNVSRLELGNMHLQLEAVKLLDITKEVSESLGLDVKKKKMTIVTTTNEKDITVQTDHSLLGLILENLLGNAIKYGYEETNIALGISVDRNKNVVMLSVQNQGMGIPENQQTQIFQKMFRGANAKTSDTDGNGLGLYLSHIAAETIGAEINFQSQEKNGTTFILTLPLTGNKTTS